MAFASVSYPRRCLASEAAAVKPLGAGALGSKLRPFSSVIFFGPFFSPVPLLGFSHLGIAAWLRQCGRVGACAIAAAAAAAAPAASPAISAAPATSTAAAAAAA